MARGGARPGAGAPKGAANGRVKKYGPAKPKVKKTIAEKIAKLLETHTADKLPLPPVELHQLPASGILSALVKIPPPPANIPDEPVEEYDPNISPKDFLLKVMRNPLEDKARRDRAAALLLPFEHAKAGEAGKKEEKNKAAKTAASGKFAVPTAPRLVSSK